MSIVCVRRLQFAAGHRVYKHESKCSHLHGHNYVVLLHAERSTGLDDLGRVVDFGVLKDLFGAWIEKHWDHGFILYHMDETAIAALQKVDVTGNTQQKVYLLNNNPTAENIALHLLKRLGPELLKDSGVELVKVQVWETENCMAEVVRD